MPAATPPCAPPSTTSIALLGLVQILVWGGSFFLMAVLAGPVVAETGWARQWVYGALSLGILVSGLLAPCSGRLIVRHGRLPLSLVPPADYPVLMGRMARPALLGQAATPLVGGYLIDVWGSGAALGVLCGLALLNLLCVAVLLQRLPRWTARLAMD